MLDVFPPVSAPLRGPKWTVSRVLFRKGLSPDAARIIHLGDTLPCRSSTLTRVPGASKLVPSNGPSSTAPLFKLAPGRACLAAGRPAVARGLLPHDFTLACAGERRSARLAIGGVISVALSLGSPRVGVTDFPALWSPDFPPADSNCPPAILRPPPTERA